jgi:hypothetical protein
MKGLMMRITTLATGTAGLAGLVAAGLLTFPTAASGSSDSQDQIYKRDEDTPDLVLVVDDDDDDDRARAANLRDDTNDGDTRTNNTRTNDNTGTGRQTGLDHSRNRQVKDYTNDGKGSHNRDFSANHTNDRSRHNTRR